jgi:hypothetical protein
MSENVDFYEKSVERVSQARSLLAEKPRIDLENSLLDKMGVLPSGIDSIIARQPFFRFNYATFCRN